MAFITRNSKGNSPLLGIVTLWDIIAAGGKKRDNSKEIRVKRVGHNREVRRQKTEAGF